MKATAEMLPVIALPDYDADQKDRNGERSQRRFQKAGLPAGSPCIICGTFTGSKPSKYIHICDGGAYARDVREMDDPSHGEFGEAGCLAMYPIGPSCLKNHPALRPYAVTPGHKQVA